VQYFMTRDSAVFKAQSILWVIWSLSGSLLALFAKLIMTWPGGRYVICLQSG